MQNITIEKTEEMKENINLPQGWVECIWEDVLDKDKHSMKRGPFGSSLKKEFFVEKGIRVFEQYNPINNDPYWARYYISKEKYNELKAFTATAGDLLISCSGTLGKILELPDNVQTGIINQALLKIRLNPNIISNKFFTYLFNSPKMQKKIFDNTIGTAIQNIASVKELKQINLFLPPLAEQERIIEKIEELFPDIDDGIKTLEKTKLQIKQYHQSVLKSAFEGKLYKTTEWQQKILSEIAEINPKTDIPNINDDDEVSFLPMPAVKAEINFYIEEKTPYSKVKKGYTRFQDNDVLFAKITPCMENGKSCVVKNLKFGVGFGSTEFHVLRCSDKLLPEFLFYFVVQSTFRITAKRFMSGAVGQQRVPADYMKSIDFLLPTIPEQQKIVKEIEKRFEVADVLEQAVDVGLEKAKQLKQSILKKAFEGKLVPQNPADEPASILLEKIKAEKATNNMNNTTNIAKIKKKDKIKLDDERVDMIIEAMHFLEERKQNRSKKTQNKSA